MNKYELAKYKSLELEIKDLNSRLHKANENSEYSSELRLKRQKKIDELVKLELEIHDFIFLIDDPEARLIFALRYLDGMTQEEIAEKLNMDRSTVSKRISKYVSTDRKKNNKKPCGICSESILYMKIFTTNGKSCNISGPMAAAPKRFLYCPRCGRKIL